MVDYTKSVSDQSVSELGKSLLAQKSERERRADKRARRNDKIQGALMIALAGKSFAKNAYTKRAAELEKSKTFQAKNNAAQTKEINSVSSILSIIPDNFMPEEKNAKTKAKSFMNNYAGEFAGKLNSYIDNKIKVNFGGDTTAFQEFKNGSQYNSVIRNAGENLLTEWFTDDKYKTFETDLRKALGEQDLDRAALLKKGMGLTEHELSAVEESYYADILNQYKNESTIMNGFKGVLEKAGLKEKSTGGIDIFNPLDNSFEGPSLDLSLKAMNLNGNFNYVVDKAIALAKTSNENYNNKIQSSAYVNYQKKIADIYLPNMAKLIEDGDYQDEVTGNIKFVEKSQMEEFMKTIAEDKDQIFIKDVGALALKFRDEPKFVKNIYKSIYGADENPSLSFGDFKSRMANEETRTQFAAGLVLENGLKEKGGSLFGLFGNETTYSGKKINEVYDRGIIPSLIGQGINMPTPETNNEFTVPKNYNELSLTTKRLDFDATYKHIQMLPVSEKLKEKMINELFKDIGNPDGIDNREEYLKDLKIRQTKEKEIYNKRRQNTFEFQGLGHPVFSSKIPREFLPMGLKTVSDTIEIGKEILK